MQRRLLLSLIFSALTLPSIAQRNGSLRLMTYNILNYRNATSWCTSSNNNWSDKEIYLQTTIGHISPDIIVFNEVGANSNNQTYLLNNVLNTAGTTNWAMSNYSDNGFSYLSNAIAYNSDRIALLNSWTITKDLNNQDLVRAINVLRFSILDSLQNLDTISFYIIAAHLKAGSDNTDEIERDLASESIINWISSNIDTSGDYVFLMGDLNVYSSTEDAYQTLTNGSGYRLHDPIQKPGNWHNNASFSNIHTQSTSTASNCKSGGGLDDRFDHILSSHNTLNTGSNFQYSTNSYTTVGNDGNHFNLDIDANTNNSVPSSVLTAISGASDHLPVYLDINFTMPLSQGEEVVENFNIPNPITIGQSLYFSENTTTEIFNILGQKISFNKGSFKVPILQEGTYLFRITSDTKSHLIRVVLTQ